MGVMQVVWSGGIWLTYKNWLTEVTITQEVQARLASFLLPRKRLLSQEVLARAFW
jgi:hypothetical protein